MLKESYEIMAVLWDEQEGYAQLRSFIEPTLFDMGVRILNVADWKLNLREVSNSFNDNNKIPIYLFFGEIVGGHIQGYLRSEEGQMGRRILSGWKIPLIFLCYNDFDIDMNDLKIYLFWGPTLLESSYLISWHFRNSNVYLVKERDVADSYPLKITKYFNQQYKYLKNIEAISYELVDNIEENEKAITEILSEENNFIYFIGYSDRFFAKVEDSLTNIDISLCSKCIISNFVTSAECYKEGSKLYQICYIDFFPKKGTTNKIPNITADTIGLLKGAIEDATNSSTSITDILERLKFYESELTKEVYLLSHYSKSQLILPLSLGNNYGIEDEYYAREYSRERVASSLNHISEISNKIKNFFPINENFIIKELYKVRNNIGNIFKFEEMFFWSFNIRFKRILEKIDNYSSTLILKEVILPFLDTTSPLQINLKKCDSEDNLSSRLYFKDIDGFIHPILFYLFKKNRKEINALIIAGSMTQAEEVNEKNSCYIKEKESIDELLDFIEKIYKEYENKPNYNFCYIIPVCNINNTSNNNIFGGIMFFSVEKKSYHTLQILTTIIKQLYEPIASHLAFSELQLAHCKSAVGQIMSRNGSHNIGSHVLAALSHNVGTMPDDRILYRYIQHRMDYIAQVTTEVPKWNAPTKFVGDMMKEFLSQHHLLEYIAKSEGLGAYKFQHHSFKVTDAFHKEQRDKIKIIIRKQGGDKSYEHVLKSKINKHKCDQAYYNFVDYVEDSPINLDLDVSVAIPGGVVGKHAFYTILENIIRNAAKHDWAQRKADSPERNLEIYIDFAENKDGKHIDFTIWSNMSSIFNYHEKDDAEKEEIAESMFTVLSMLKNSNSAIIDEITKAKLAKVENKTMTEQEFADSLATNNYEPFNRELSKSDRVIIKKYREDKSNKRVTLPLHWEQQLLLDKSFIQDNGELRRENWGLYEMKISAGYLRALSSARIGGIDFENEDDSNKIGKDDDIITPIAMPGICRCSCNNNNCSNCTNRISCKNCELVVNGGCEGCSMADDCKNCKVKANCITKKKYHLGYQFSIKKPKEILIVLDGPRPYIDESGKFIKEGNEINKEDLSEVDKQKLCRNSKFDDAKDSLNKAGIYFEYSDSITPTTYDFSYEYVILPESLKDEYIQYCPLRVLLYKQDYNFNDIIQDSDVMKNTIYASWLKKYRETDRYDIDKDFYLQDYNLEVEEKTISLAINVHDSSSDSSEAGQGLVNNRDIVKVLFNENFHSVVTTYLSQNRDSVPENFALALAATANASLKIDNEDNEVNLGEPIDLIIEQLKKWFIECSEKIRKVDESSVLINIIKEFITSFNIPISMQLEAINKDYISKCCEEIGYQAEKPGDMDSLDKYFQYEMDLNDNHMIDNNFISAMVLSFNQLDVLLRKYEECITTLPKGYSIDLYNNRNNDNDNTPVCNDMLPGVKFYNKGLSSEYDKIDSPSIMYTRHFSFKNAGLGAINETKYIEPLSGVQSYLYTLSKLKNDNGIITKLIENALTNILIVDERMYNFYKQHKDTQATFNTLNIGVFDISKPFDIFSDLKISRGDFNLTTSGSNRGEKFEVLIIHQGMIDKILDNNQSKFEGVESFLAKMQVKYKHVVITTGRGRPANIPDSARVLPFSTVEDCLFRKYPEKLILVETIMNILPQGDKRNG